MTLLAHVDRLRRIADHEPETSLFQVALLNVLEELAATVDRLTNGEDEPPGFGSI